MKMEGISFEATDWHTVGSVAVDGRTGGFIYKEIDRGNFRIRHVEYSARYEADHWCPKGHIIWVLDGDLTIQLEGGGAYSLRKGMSAVVGDDVAPHRAYSRDGAEVVIID